MLNASLIKIIVTFLVGLAINISYALPTDSAFFSAVNLDYPGLDSTKQYVALKEYDNAKRVYVDFVTHRTDRKFFYNYNQKDSIMAIVRSIYPGLDTLSAASISSANKTLAGILCVNSVCDTFSGNVDWLSIPPGGSPEYPAQIQRHTVFYDLGLAYWITGNIAYRNKMISLFKDWITNVPQSSWHSIDAGIRIHVWFYAYNFIVNSPDIPYQDYFDIFKSMMQHGNFLSPYQISYNPSNFQVLECLGFVKLGLFFPEWKNSATWFSRSIARFNDQLLNGFLPDGYHNEVSGIYHSTVHYFPNIENLCKLNNLTDFSAPAIAHMKKAFEAYFSTNLSTGWYCMTGDARLMDNGVNIEKFFNMGNVNGAVTFANSTFKTLLGPDDFGWRNLIFDGLDAYNVYSNLPIKDTVLESNYMPNARLFTMRSNGRGYKDTTSLYGFLDMASAAGVIDMHAHWDALNVVFAGYGRQLLIDPGIGNDYNDIHYSFYVRPIAHNVIVMDSIQGSGSRGNSAFYLKHAINSGFDYAKGYTDGVSTLYRHTREVLFIKGEYWLLRDKVTGFSSQLRRAEQLFHLFPSTPVVDLPTRSIASNYGALSPNITIIPIVKESLDVKVRQNGYVFIDNRKDEPGYTHEAAPIITYLKRKVLPITFENVLYPVQRGRTESVVTSPVAVVYGNVDVNVNSGSEISIGANKKDWVAWSDDTDRVLFMNGMELKGEAGVFRWQADSIYGSMLLGIQLLYRNIYGIVSASEVSFSLQGKSGEITLANNQSVTFYYPGIQQVRIDGSAATPISQTSGSLTVNLTAGKHEIAIEATGRIVVQSCPDTTVVAPVIWKGSAQTYSTVEIGWHAVPDASYMVYRDSVFLTSTSDTSIVDNTVDLIIASSYRYSVVAVNTCGLTSTASTGWSVLAPSNLPTRLHATEDTYIQDGTSASTNYGKSAGLLVKEASNIGVPTRWAFLKFDFSVLSTDTIVSGKLRLYVEATQDGTPVPVTAKSVPANSWSEMALNWNNKPTPGASLATINVSGAGKYYEWDVTGYLRAALKSDQTASFYMQDTETKARYINFASREHADSTHHPMLLIVTDTSRHTNSETGLAFEVQSLSISPNPFNPSVNIRINGWRTGAMLKIVDIGGRVVADLTTAMNGSSRNTGAGVVTWDAVKCASGVYVVVFQNRGSELKRMITLIR